MLEIKESVFNYIKETFKENSFEQGFILGCTSRLDFIDTCTQIRAVQAGLYFYSPDAKEATEAIRNWREQGVCFCGFIHSHMTNKKEFSENDILFAKKLIQNFNMPYLWFGLMVITEDKAEATFYQLLYENSEVVLTLNEFRTIC